MGQSGIGAAVITGSGTTSATGTATIRNVTGTLHIGGDIDVAQTSSVTNYTANGTGTLVLDKIGRLEVLGDFDVGQVSGTGSSTAMASATVSGVPTIIVGGDIDVGVTSGSPNALNRGTADLSIASATLQVGFGNPLTPGMLSVGSILTAASEQAASNAEVAMNQVQFAAAGGIEVATLTGAGGTATNHAAGKLSFMGGHVEAPSVNVATVAPGTAGTTTGRLNLNSTLMDIAGAISMGSGATLSFALAGTMRADGSGALNQYAAINSGSAILDGILEVSLVNGFQPIAGQQFSLLQAGSITGSFDSIVLPTLAAGLNWNVSSGTTNFLLSVVGAALSGDYNGNGSVDAADYTVWRNSLGSTVVLAADGNGNHVVDQADYAIWKSNFGSSIGAGSTAMAAALPEPSMVPILTVVFSTAAILWRSRPNRRLRSWSPIRSKYGNRLGFTLVELLVVIAIIGTLVGLLMPAVQSSRESARRTQCVNNLRQFGMAFLNHHDTHRYFPSGGRNWTDPPTYVKGRPTTGSSQYAGWGFQVLPYIEEGTIYDSGPLAAIETPLTVFFCPTRRPPQTIAGPDTYLPPIHGGEINRAMSDYAASNRGLTGVVRRYQPLRIAQIVDGTSHTLAVAEKRLNLAYLGESQDDDNEGYTVGWNEDTIRKTSDPPEPDFYGDGDGEKLFGSSHPDGLNAAVVDGSVRQIAFDVGDMEFDALGNVADDVASKLP